MCSAILLICITVPTECWLEIPLSICLVAFSFRYANGDADASDDVVVLVLQVQVENVWLMSAGKADSPVVLCVAISLSLAKLA